MLKFFGAFLDEVWAALRYLPTLVPAFLRHQNTFHILILIFYFLEAHVVFVTQLVSLGVTLVGLVQTQRQDVLVLVGVRDHILLFEEA